MDHIVHPFEDHRQSASGSFLNDRPYTYSTSAQQSPPFAMPLTRPITRFLEESDRTLFTLDTMDDPNSFPEILYDPIKYIDLDASLQSLPERYPSPTHSGYASSHMSSSNWSDRERTPYSSPGVSSTRSPYVEHAHMNLEYHDARQSRLGTGAGHCVALHDVQQYADAQLEKISFDDEHIAYGTSAQEGYHPMAMDGEVRRHGLILPSQRDADNDTFEMDSNEVKPLRRKRHSHRKIDPPYSPSKITKRPSGSKRRSCSGAKASSDINTSAKTNIHRTFHCPFALYGCQSTFGSKNEWKRHVSTQHMRLGYWRCDQCPHSNHRPNDFNRKDLFIQHVRRMHAISTDDARLTKKRKAGNSVRGHKDDAEEAELANIARRCHRQLRSAPERSSCLFCDARFDGASSWEERMEHVGKHMEAAKKTEEAPKTLGVWRHDQVFEDWLLAEGLVVRVKGRVVLADMQ